MTKVLKIDPLDIDFALIKEAATVIKTGGLVAFPTETVYGLGANIFDEKAVRNVFKAKARSTNKPLAVCVSDLSQLTRIVLSIPKEAEELIAEFLPGPLTLILLKKRIVSPRVTASSHSVGIRYPDNKLILALIDYAGVPIAATSANISGKPSPSTAQEVLSQLSSKIDLVIDGGPTKLKMVSTVIDFTSSPYKIVREGALPTEEIDHFLRGKGYLPVGT